MTCKELTNPLRRLVSFGVFRSDGLWRHRSIHVLLKINLSLITYVVYGRYGEFYYIDLIAKIFNDHLHVQAKPQRRSQSPANTSV